MEVERAVGFTLTEVTCLRQVNFYDDELLAKVNICVCYSAYSDDLCVFACACKRVRVSDAGSCGV